MFGAFLPSLLSDLSSREGKLMLFSLDYSEFCFSSMAGVYLLLLNLSNKALSFDLLLGVVGLFILFPFDSTPKFRS